MFLGGKRAGEISNAGSPAGRGRDINKAKKAQTLLFSCETSFFLMKSHVRFVFLKSGFVYEQYNNIIVFVHFVDIFFVDY